MKANTIKNKVFSRAKNYRLTPLNNREKEPSKTSLIIDTDMGNDIDDALALILAYALESEGKCNVLGIAINKDNYYSPIYTDIVNTFYGRGDVEIGVIKDGKTPDDGCYTKPIVEAKINGEYKYKRSKKDYTMDSVSLYRKLLVQAKDNSVSIVSIGFFTNLARLLVSDADDYSELNGKDLVAKKVKFLSAMAGSFSPNSEVSCEFNIRRDIESAKYVCEHWPTKIVFSGHEVGNEILYPADSITGDFNWAKHHPVVEAYHLYGKMPYDRPSWDLTSVLCAVRPIADYFDISVPGRVVITDKGATEFEADEKGMHRYLINRPDRTQFLQDLMVGLCSKKPESVKSLV